MKGKLELIADKYGAFGQQLLTIMYGGVFQDENARHMTNSGTFKQKCHVSHSKWRFKRLHQRQWS